VTESVDARDAVADDAADAAATHPANNVANVATVGNSAADADLPDSSPFARYARYGRPRRDRRTKVRNYALIGAGVAAMTAVVSYFGLRAASPPISATVLSYSVTSAHSVTVRFEVTKSSTKAAVCVVEAPDVNSDIVGRTVVNVPAGQSRVTLSTTLRTTDRAIMGEVEQCVTATN
jgi:hypothetical protein